MLFTDTTSRTALQKTVNLDLIHADVILTSQSKYEKNTNCTALNCCSVTGFVVRPFGLSFNGRHHQTQEKHLTLKTTATLYQSVWL